MSLNCDVITPKNAAFVTILNTNMTSYSGTALSTVTFKDASLAELTCLAYISSFGDMWVLALPMAVHTTEHVAGHDSAFTSTAVVITNPNQRPETDVYGYYSLQDWALTPSGITDVGDVKIGTDGVLTLYAMDGSDFLTGTDYRFFDIVLHWKKNVTL
jgi:hypothetical protein